MAKNETDQCDKQSHLLEKLSKAYEKLDAKLAEIEEKMASSSLPYQTPNKPR